MVLSGNGLKISKTKQMDNKQLARQNKSLEELNGLRTNLQNAGLSSNEVEIAICNEYPAIRCLSRDELESGIVDLIQMAHLNCGYKYNPELVLITLDSLIGNLLRFFSTLSLKDIENAFNRGLIKEYGEFTGLSNMTYLSWVKYYMVSDIRIKALKSKMRVIKHLEYKEPEYTQEQKDQIILDGVIKCFENFTKTGILYDAGNVTYNYLEKIGVINLTNERKAEIRKIVEARMEQEAIDRKGYETKQQALLKYMETDKIKSECKREALKIHFKMMVEMEMDIKDLLNE